MIEKRIQRLEKELQAILTIASVEGETFTAEVVARVQQLDERGLVQQLSRELDKRHRLVTAQILAWLGQQRLSLYRFRHHLFQHYLYHNLDRDGASLSARGGRERAWKPSTASRPSRWRCSWPAILSRPG